MQVGYRHGWCWLHLCIRHRHHRSSKGLLQPDFQLFMLDLLILAYIPHITPHIDQWFVVMSTQMIGFSIGGIAKRFLVSPPSMSRPFRTSPVSLPHSHVPAVWPANLVYCALFNTLHSQEVGFTNTQYNSECNFTSIVHRYRHSRRYLP